MILTLSVLGALIAALPAVLFVRNLNLFVLDEIAPKDVQANRVPISVLIPARNEAEGIEKSITAALNSESVIVEVCVMDDHSTDQTSAIVKAMADDDDRIRYIESRPLPEGWNGKQHACWQLSVEAKYNRMVFLDADVQLHPTALAKLSDHFDRTNVRLLSGFPRQLTGSWLERWIMPLMHYILLGYLPLARMRSSTHPAYAAGCGQLFLTEKQAYQKAGTHAIIRASRHDGIKLPKAYRQSGMVTDVVDATELAECRMYHGAGEVVRGVLKNASEGIANPIRIVPFTVLLIGGSVVPVATLCGSVSSGSTLGMGISAIGVILGHIPRAISAVRFRQPVTGVLFHSAATLVFVTLQWIALTNQVLGITVRWRGRN